MPDFYAEFSNAVALRAEGNSAFRLDAFGEEAAERLESAEVVQDLTIVSLRCIGRRGAKLGLLGYAEDPADSSLIIVCHAMYDQPGATLSTAEARAAFKAGVGFIEQSVDGYLADTLELSSREAEHARYFREILRRSQRNSLDTIARFKFILISDGQVSGRIRSFENDEVCGLPASYSIWDLGRFEELARSESGQDDYDVDLTKWLPDGLPCLPAASSDASTKSYLAVLPARLLADVFNEHGSQLLESNVRTFLSARGKVNRGIQRTLSSEPEKFLSFNNGLTTTATGVVVEDAASGPRIMSLRNWQIVNGGQTTASIAHFARTQKSSAIDEVYVPMKLVTVEPASASETVSSISRYANSQNAVSEADLFSNSPFHIRLEQISRRLLAPTLGGGHASSKWFYERARGQWENQRNAGPSSHVRRFELEYPKKQRITKTDWAKYAFSWGKRPHEVSRGAQSNFMSFAKLASELWEKDQEQFGDSYFRSGVAKAIIYAETRALVMTADWYSTGYLANIVTFAIARFAHEIDVRYQGHKYDLERVWKRQALSDPTRASLELIARSMQGLLTDDDRPQANVTQWAKQEEAWRRAKLVVVTVHPGLESDLVDADEDRTRNRDSKRERQVDSGLEIVSRVLSIERSTWTSLLSSTETARLLSPTDVGVIQWVASGKVPSDLQAARAWRALQRCVDEGVLESGAFG